MSSNKKWSFLTFLKQLLGIGVSKVASYPYRASDRFLSIAEYSFYMVAKKVLADRFLICPQVPLSAIFFITDKKNYTSAFNRIARKRIDYLVCDGLTVKPLFGIELDDKSHQRADRIERDIFVEKVFDVSGMPLIRVPLKNAYSTSELESLFAGVLRSINWQPSQPGKNNTPLINENQSRSVILQNVLNVVERWSFELPGVGQNKVNNSSAVQIIPTVKHLYQS